MESRTEIPIFSEPKLIELVKRKPALWNHNDAYYNNRTLEKDCWVEISDLLEADVETCKKKWQNLRNQYRRELLRTKQSKWKHFTRLSFLADIFNSKSMARRIQHVREDEDPIRIKRDDSPMEQNSTFVEEMYDSSFSNGTVPQVEPKHTPPRTAVPTPVANVASDSNYYFALSLVGLLNSLSNRNQLAARIAILSKINEFQAEQEECLEEDKNNFL